MSVSGRADTVASPWRPALSQRLLIRFARMCKWEFWPAWLFYVPVIAWIVLQGVRTRRPTAFTATNPLLDHGGVVGERKWPPLEALSRALPELVPTTMPISGDEPIGVAAERAADALRTWPLVVKPDIGQRGRGVRVVGDRAALAAALEAIEGDRIVQRHVAGEEYGVFVVRDPGNGHARVTSIVHKRFPSVQGDGERTLLQLIHGDSRARLIAPLLERTLAAHLDHVPAREEEIALVELGSHCRGAVFEDARSLMGPGLDAVMQQLLEGLPGFHYGRLDLRCPNAACLSKGEGLQILEINGVTAEPAHVYHPGASLWKAWGTFFAHWRIAFDIGVANARAGVPITPALTLLRLFRDDMKRGARFD